MNFYNRINYGIHVTLHKKASNPADKLSSTAYGLRRGKTCLGGFRQKETKRYFSKRE